LRAVPGARPAQGLNEYFLLNGDSWTDYGLPSVETFIKQGDVVVGTDYQGLGGGGRHQYAVAASQARDVIDSIRAAGSIKATGAGKKAIVNGWSQGGGATLAAASLPNYTPTWDGSSSPESRRIFQRPAPRRRFICPG
jgi:hypothetical protein